MLIMLEAKSLEAVGLEFIGLRKGCRWACDRPSSGQVSDWTSFEVLVVKDEEGNRLWCRNFYYPSHWGNNNFSPIPEGAQILQDQELPEALAFWDQNELAALEQQAK